VRDHAADRLLADEAGRPLDHSVRHGAPITVAATVDGGRTVRGDDAVASGLLVKRSRTFAELTRRRVGWRVSVLLDRTVADPRVARTLRLSAHRVAVSTDVATVDELDGTVRAWLAESYAASPD